MIDHPLPAQGRASEVSEPADIAKIVEAANKLAYEVARLRTDIARLHGRIEPFKDEVKRLDPLWPDERVRNASEALNAIAEARKSIQGCEYHLADIRGVIDSISKDAIPRHELKPYIRDK